MQPTNSVRRECEREPAPTAGPTTTPGRAEQTGRPPAPATIDERVGVLDACRRLRVLLEDALAGPPAEGWTEEQLRALAYLVSAEAARLLAGAPCAVQRAYHDHLAAVSRGGL
jgi:hypothetical protein